MVTQCDINGMLLKAKLCSSIVSISYVNSIRFGYKKKEEDFFNKLVLLKGYIRILEEYEISDGVFAEDGILYRFGKKVVISKNNSLSLDSKSQKILLSEEKLNCFSEEELCELSGKVSSICSTC